MSETRLLVKRYPLPDYCDCREVVMRELSGLDAMDASTMAEASVSADVTTLGQLAAEQRESLRLALVEVDGVAVNSNGSPFMAMDKFSNRTMRFLQEFYTDLNGVEQKDLKKAIAGGSIVLPSGSHQGGTGPEE